MSDVWTHTKKNQNHLTDGACKVKSLAIIDSISVDHLMILNATIVLIYSEL